MQTDAEPLPADARLPLPVVAGVIATVAVFAIAQSLSYPLLSFILESQGHSAGLIGLSAAMTPIGMVISALAVPALARRYGSANLAIVCAATAFVTLLLLGLVQNLWAWFPLRLLIGMAINPLYILSEAWLLTLTPAAKRGRVMGFYSSTIQAGFAAGPFALWLVGVEGWAPFLIGLVAFAACSACILGVRKGLPKVESSHGERTSVFGFVLLAPSLLMAVLCASAFEQGTFAMMPLYGRDYGIDAETISALLAVLIAGNIVFQVPIGMLAERWSPRAVLVLAALLTVGGAALLPVVIDSVLIWPFVFLWGPLSYAVHTLSLIELGARFTGNTLIAGNAAFALMWGFGGIIGPSAMGGAMDVLGPDGLPLVIGTLYLGLAGLAGLRRAAKE